MTNLFKALLFAVFVTSLVAVQPTDAQQQRNQSSSRSSHLQTEHRQQASTPLKICGLMASDGSRSSRSVEALCRNGRAVNSRRYESINTDRTRGFDERHALATIFPFGMNVYLDLLTGEESAGYYLLSDLKRGPDGQLIGAATLREPTGFFRKNGRPVVYLSQSSTNLLIASITRNGTLTLR